MRIATWNVNSIRVRVDHVAQWVEMAQPDVLAIQELKAQDHQFPTAAFEEMGYPYHLVHGQKAYNGVAIVSKLPISDAHKGLDDGEEDTAARYVDCLVGGLRLINCYVPAGAPVGSDNFAYKLRWMSRLSRKLERDFRDEPNLMLVGDINIAPGELDVHDPFAFHGEIAFTDQEHAAFQKLIDFGLTDSFRSHAPYSQQFSWWDYRGQGFRRGRGIRIDHILVTESLMKRKKRVEIDPTPRGWDRPTDHAPKFIDLDT